MEALVEEECLQLHIGPHTGPNKEKMSDIYWSWRYFDINNADNTACELYGIFLLTYWRDTTISIGVGPAAGFNVEDVERKEAGNTFSFTKAPYVDKEWWSYLWFELDVSQLQHLDSLSSLDEQKEILRSFLKEVMTIVRRNQN
ncbi:MAG: hypothetical protein NC453_24040 [Muribaculum sp.]|nr:hypothetical protein [Muribaculum sp.]